MSVPANFGPHNIDFSPLPYGSTYLALSGGGFRATAHHLGVLLAFLRYDMLGNIGVVCGVSGGAITAAHFASWMSEWIADGGRPQGLEALRSFARPLIDVMRQHLIASILLRGPFVRLTGWFTASRQTTVEKLLDRHLFQGKPLSSLYPPLTVIVTTDLASGRPFYLTSAGCGVRAHTIWDARAATYETAGYASAGAMKLPIARAVGASAAYPLAFAATPLLLRGEELTDYINALGWQGLSEATFPKGLIVHLADGGVSDNRGLTFLEQLISFHTPRRGWVVRTPFEHVAVFDAGRAVEYPFQRSLGRWSSFARTLHCLADANEKLVERLVRVAIGGTDIETYGVYRALPELSDILGIDKDILVLLLQMRTDLDRFTDTEIFCAAYAGYALATYSLERQNWLSEKRDTETTRREFQEILSGLVAPLSCAEWRGHLLQSRSRSGFARKLARMTSRR